jgi:hypothetical protein
MPNYTTPITGAGAGDYGGYTNPGGSQNTQPYLGSYGQQQQNILYPGTANTNWNQYKRK